MHTNACSLAHLTDDQLLATVKTLAAGERRATVELIASLAELDARRLHLGQGCSSLFIYCTRCLHLSEHAAYARIAAARVASKWPVIFEMLSNGSITLTTVCLLRKLLNEARLGLHGGLRLSAGFPTPLDRFPATRDTDPEVREAWPPPQQATSA